MKEKASSGPSYEYLGLWKEAGLIYFYPILTSFFFSNFENIVMFLPNIFPFFLDLILKVVYHFHLSLICTVRAPRILVFSELIPISY